MEDFKEIKDEKELKEFVEFCNNFHDGRIVEMNCRLGAIKEENRRSEVYSLKIRIEDVYFENGGAAASGGKKLKGVEILFDQIEKVFFSPAEKDDFLFIFDATLILRDNKFIFNAFDESEQLIDLGRSSLFVSAEKLSYRLF